MDAALTLMVVVAVVVALARDLAAPSAVVLAGTVTLLVVGVIEPDQAFSGFANPAPITVAALYVLAAAVQQTGVLERMVAHLIGGTASVRTRLARLVLPTVAASAFLNNTPIVAILAPAVATISERSGRSATPFLIPVSYAAILGGVITLLGTSTNLVVSGLLEDAGLSGLSVFELTPVGLPVALVGAVVVIALAPVLLPERRAALRTFEEGLRDFTVTMEVVPRGTLDGAALGEAGLRSLQGVYCVSVRRDEREIAPVPPSTRLAGGDQLTFVGNVARIVDLQRNPGLRSMESGQLERLGNSGHQLYEAVVGQNSPLVGSTLRGIDFRNRHQAAVMAIHRAGQHVEGKLGEVELRPGDSLLLLTDLGFRTRWQQSQDFVLVRGVPQPPPANRRQTRITGLVAAAVVLVSGAGLLPILETSLLGAFALVATGVLRPYQARAAVDLDVIVVIAAAFGLGAAMESSGLAARAAEVLLSGVAPFGPRGALIGVLVGTMVLTEVVTNNAAAVLAFPIALAAAGDLGVDPRGFAVAVALGASLDFVTPIGYQTNLMVYGLGGYRFGDFARLGVPLSLFVVVTAALLVPVFWPL